MWLVGLFAAATAGGPLVVHEGRALRIVVHESGAVEVAAPGRKSAWLRLACWDTSGRYAMQPAETREGKVWREDGTYRVTYQLRAGDEAVLDVVQTIAPKQGALRIAYDIAPVRSRAGRIVLRLYLPRSAWAQAKQFFAPTISCRIPARFNGGIERYALEASEGECLELVPAKPADVQAANQGSNYLVTFDLGSGDEARRAFALDIAAAAAPESWPGIVKGDNRPLQIADVKPARARVEQYGRFEAFIDLRATYENPFDPDEIAVDAHLFGPDGREVVVPCFFMIDFKRRVVGDVEILEPRDGGSWRVRFTPDKPGRWRFWIAARDRTGTVTWRGGRIDVVPSNRPGFVRIAPNGRYFQLSTGGAYFPIGHNLPTYHSRRFLPDRELRKMKAGGENYNRWWLYSRALGLEWDWKVGWYRQTEAWRLDHLLELAEKIDFRFMLCLDTHQDFRGTRSWQGWPNNPYNRALGGPCEKPADFFTNPEARALYRKRLRYLVARYSWSTRILAWEFGNEFEGWPQTPPEDLAAWHREMSDYLRRLDPHGHLITTSFWTPTGRPEIWSLPNIDIVQTHHYANARVDMARMVADDCREKLSAWRKPHLYGEVGLHSRFLLEPQDKRGVYLHNTAWAALASGAASTAMSWWHERYIAQRNLFGMYRGIARFVRRLHLDRGEWRPIEVLEQTWIRKPPWPPGDVVIAPRFGWGKPEVTRFEVRPDGTVSDAASVPRLLQGRGHRDLRAPITFVVTYPKPGRFVVRVGTVSAGGLLIVSVDGEEVLRRELPCGPGHGKSARWRPQWSLWESTYDEDIGVEVPAGRHEITLFNDGRDWISVQEYRFEGCRTWDAPSHLVLGMASDRQAFVWVRNGDFTWFNDAAGKVRTAPEAEAVIAGLADGRWRVERWDTWAGRPVAAFTAHVRGGKLRLRVPRLRRDVAYLLTRVAD